MTLCVYMAVGLISIASFRCGDGRPLRTWFRDSDDLLDFSFGVVIWPLCLAYHVWTASKQ